MQNKSLTLILLLLSIGSIYADNLIEYRSLWKWDCVQQTREWLSTVKSTEISPMVFQHMPYEHKLGGGYAFRFYNRAKYKKLSTTMSKRLLNTINQYDKSIRVGIISNHAHAYCIYPATYKGFESKSIFWASLKTQ